MRPSTQKVVAYLSEHETATTYDIARHYGMTDAAARNAVQRAVADGAILRVLPAGSKGGRTGCVHAVYRLNPRPMQQAEPPRGYVPNVRFVFEMASVL